MYYLDKTRNVKRIVIMRFIENSDEQRYFLVEQLEYSSLFSCFEKTEQGSPGKLKARQLAKARNWEAELRFKKSETLHPIVIGVCWWTPESSSSDPLYSKLREFQVGLRFFISFLIQ
jgi:hypothetical protein